MANFVWNTTGTANWNTGADWNSGTVPNGTGNNAFINQGGVTLTSNQTVDILTVNNGSLFLNNAGKTLTVTTLTLNGNTGGVININAAATLTTTNFTQAGGSFNMNAGNFDVTGSNNDVLFTGGNFTLSGGAVGINRNFNISGGTFNQSGGTLTENRNVFISSTGAFIEFSGSSNIGRQLNISGNGVFRLSGNGTVNLTSANNLTVTGNGTFNQSGGQFNITNNTATANFNGGTINLGGNFNTAGLLNVSGGTVSASGLNITARNLNVSSGSLNEFAGAVTVSNNLTVSGGTFNQSGGTMAVGNASFTGGTDAISSTFNASGTVTIAGTTLTLGSGAALTAASISDAGTLIGQGKITGTFSNNTGIVEASGGTLELATNIGASTGLAFEIANSAASNLQLDGSVGSGDTFTFLGTSATPAGELSLASDTAFGGTISQLFEGTSNASPTTFIDIIGNSSVSITAGGSGTGSSGTLTLSDGATLTLSNIANLHGTWFANWTTAGSDTEIWLSDSVCYAAGTHILTARGEVEIERLAVGDTVTAVVDGERIERPVKWIGWRRINVAAQPHPQRVLPIRIERDAFGPATPHRDLYVSPNHAIVVDGVLVCAQQLVNRTTIRQEAGWKTVEYFHLELDSHAILLAEGLPAESYIDTGNQGFFANSDTPLVLHPDLTQEADLGARAAASCVPFVTDEATVRPIWQRLADRAAALDRVAPSLETTTDPELRLVARGRTVRPIYGENGLYIFPLTRGLQDVRLVSRANPPGDARPWLTDPRRLGVCVARLVVRGTSEVQSIAVDYPELSDGWWRPERSGVAIARWTNGDAMLPLPAVNGPAMLEVHLHGHGQMIYIEAQPMDVAVETESKVA